MKKEYINPEMQVITFAAPVVLQSASPMNLNNEEATGNVLSSEFFDNGGSEEW
jgi:hypothetical protein